MQNILNLVLILEAQIIGLIIILLIIGDIYERVSRKLNPYYPFCDIDPRCHIAFAWDRNGNGWIGNRLVVPNRRTDLD